MNRSCALTATLLLAAATPASAQSVEDWLTGVEVASTDFYVEWPFEERDGLLVVSLAVAGAEHDFVFDTGAMVMLRPALVSRLETVEHQSMDMADFLGRGEPIEIHRAPRLQLGGIEVRHAVVAAHDFSATTAARCLFEPYSGIVGPNLFRGAAYQLDYEAGVLRITDQPERLPGLDGAVVVEAELMAQGTPALPTYLGDRYIGTHKVDTGYSGHLASGREALPLKRLDGRRRSDAVQAASLFGTASGTVRGHHGVAPELAFGSPTGARLADVPLDIVPGSSNVLGNQLLRRFRVTVRGDEVLLEPTGAPPPPTPEGLGLSFTRTDEGLVVQAVVRRGRGRAAGLRAGDLLLEVDGVPARAGADAPCSSAQAAVAALTAAVPGQEVELTIRRGDKVRSMVLR